MPAFNNYNLTEPLMTVPELAQMLRKSEAWVYRKSRSGVIPTVMVGRSRRFSRSDLVDVLDQLAMRSR